MITKMRYTGQIILKALKSTGDIWHYHTSSWSAVSSSPTQSQRESEWMMLNFLRWCSWASCLCNQPLTGVMSANKNILPSRLIKVARCKAPNHTSVIYATAAASTPNQPQSTGALICMTSVARTANQAESEKRRNVMSFWCLMKHGRDE